MTSPLQTPVLYRSFRARTGQTIGGTVNSAAWELTAGTYADLPALMAEIAARLTAAAGVAFTCAAADSDRGAAGVTIARGGTAFDLTVHETLQDTLGLDATYTGVAAATSSTAPTIVYVPTYPIADSNCWYEYVRAETVHQSGASVTALRATIAHWSGRVIGANIDQWRAFFGSMLHGTPLRLYHNYPTDTSSWSLANLDGYLDLVLARPELTEAWLTDPATVVLDVPLDCLVV